MYDRVRVAHGRNEGHPGLEIEAKRPVREQEDDEGGDREERAGQIDVVLQLVFIMTLLML